MKNKLKRIVASILTGVMMLGLCSMSVAAADPATTFTWPANGLPVEFGTVPVTAQGNQVKSAGTVLEYSASADKYDMTYGITIPMDAVWSMYDLMTWYSATGAQKIGLGGVMVAHTDFDPKLTIDESKFTVVAVQESFEASDTFFAQLLDVTEASVSGHTMTVKMQVKDGVTGAVLAQLKSANGGSLNPIATVNLPAGAVSLPKSEFVENGTIETTSSSFTADIDLIVGNEEWDFPTRLSNLLKDMFSGEGNEAIYASIPDKVNDLILPFDATMQESVVTMRHMSSGTEETPANIQLVKDLRMDPDVVTPDTSFDFTFAPVSVDGDASDTAKATMPAVGTQTITYTSADVGTSDGLIKTVTKPSADVFNIGDFDHAGTYVYEVTETAGSLADMTYSTERYYLTVYIANRTAPDADGNTLYIAAVHANGTGGVTVGVGGKCEPKFTNDYVQRGGEDASLTISKTTVGEFADKTKQFDVVVTLEKTAIDPATEYVGTITRAPKPSSPSPSPEIVTFPVGTPTTVKLSDGDVLSFASLPVGTKYTAVETGTANYTPQVSVVVNGGTATVTPGTTGTDLTTGQNVIGVGTNSAAFTNTYMEITPTGIVVNNLPFIMMIFVAIVGAVLFVVVRRRKYNR